MAQVTIYKDADVTVQVLDGPPPVDQSAEVAALTAQVQSLTASNVALQAKITNAQAALA